MEKETITKTVAKRLFAIFYIALLCLVVFITVSCGSRKKTVDKTEEATELVITDKEEKKIDKTEETKKETNAKKEVTKETETQDFNVEIEDPSKGFELEKETKDGKITWRGTNIKNLSNKKETSKEESKDSSVTKEETKSKTKEASKKDNSTAAKAKHKASNTGLEVERGFPWWILIVVGITYGVISYFRGLNPLKWLS